MKRHRSPTWLQLDVYSGPVLHVASKILLYKQLQTVWQEQLDELIAAGIASREEASATERLNAEVSLVYRI